MASFLLINKQRKRLLSGSHKAALLCVFSSQDKKVQGQNCAGKPRSSAEHQTNGVFHLCFTSSLAAKRETGHESAVIMVSYCVFTSQSFFCSSHECSHRRTVASECSSRCNGLTAVRQASQFCSVIVGNSRNCRVILRL